MGFTTNGCLYMCVTYLNIAERGGSAAGKWEAAGTYVGLVIAVPRLDPDDPSIMLNMPVGENR